VGYGESILIEYDNCCNERGPGGRFNILIDGGSAQDTEYEGFSQRIRTIDFLKEKGIGKIDLLVISHIHDDHVCGLAEVVKQLEVTELWCNCRLPDELLGKRLHNPFGRNESLWKFVNALNAYSSIPLITLNTTSATPSSSFENVT
jgi:beta-lactamase superfamily II metal-dependent hydrolase